MTENGGFAASSSDRHEIRDRLLHGIAVLLGREATRIIGIIFISVGSRLCRQLKNFSWVSIP